MVTYMFLNYRKQNRFHTLCQKKKEKKKLASYFLTNPS